MPIRTTQIAGVADSADPAKIQPSHLNIMAVPGAPQDGDVWIEATGVSPARTITVYVRDGGVSRAITSITV